MKSRLREAVFDTTLLTCVEQVGVAELLPLVFSRVRVPPEVRAEIGRGRGKARQRLNRLMRESGDFYVICTEFDPFELELLKADLDEGESAVIAQASATGAVAVIDEKKGVKQARLRDIEVVRTGRLLLDLKECGGITSVAPFLDRLIASGFALSPRVRHEILRLAGED